MIAPTALPEPGMLSPLGRQFWSYVEPRLQGGCLPRSSFDPVDMPTRVLPWLTLFDVFGPGRYVCRLFGTGLVVGYGKEMTGRTLDDCEFGEPIDWTRLAFDTAVASRSPSLARIALTMTRDIHTLERIVVPIMDAKGAVAFVAVFFQFLAQGGEPALPINAGRFVSQVPTLALQ